MGDFYQALGVKRLINAAGNLTRLGGQPYPMKSWKQCVRLPSGV
jgi:hypothetical protein